MCIHRPRRYHYHSHCPSDSVLALASSTLSRNGYYSGSRHLICSILLLKTNISSNRSHSPYLSPTNLRRHKPQNNHLNNPLPLSPTSRPRKHLHLPLLTPVRTRSRRIRSKPFPSIAPSLSPITSCGHERPRSQAKFLQKRPQSR
jgi:hypothetical protein